MIRIALNFICKNESHIVERMMSSALPVIDVIVAVDTGSTDDTMNVIKNFGEKNNLPTYVFQRPFDNFCHSRNHAIKCLKEVIATLEWNPADIWGLTFDCDEILIVAGSFKKEDISSDVHFVRVVGEGGSFNRQCLYHLSKELQWEGPIHEIIEWRDDSITCTRLDSLGIHYENVGGSWKGDLEKKYSRYAEMLAQYVMDGNEKCRWANYAGKSYVSAWEYSSSETSKRQYIENARKWFEKALTLDTRSADEKIAIHLQLANVRMIMGEDWGGTKELLLGGLVLDRRRAECIARILTHYMSAQKWHIAYIFSSFAARKYHHYDPYANGATDTEDELYQWKLLFYHSICCYMTGRKGELRESRRQLDEIIHQPGARLSYKDLLFIGLNRPLYLWLRKRLPWAKKMVY